jgi:hypothetical protein
MRAPLIRATLLLGLTACAGDPTATGAPPVVTVAVGTPEKVMDWRRDRCEDLDLPDVQARALRSPEAGGLLLVSGNAPRNYVMAGPGFGTLRRRCDAPVLVSEDSWQAAAYGNQEWVAAVYREGGVVHALVHNEYHDPVAPNCLPGVTDPGNPCWWNSITYARSLDGGLTFTRAPAPARVVAAPPLPWHPGTARGGPGPSGYFSPSNIVRGPGGLFYSMLFAIPDPARPAERGTCLMRTATLGDPASWRAWDGSGFTVRMGSPFHGGGGTPCAFVARDSIRDLSGSLTWNTFLERWVLVGSWVGPAAGGGFVCGTYFALSEDLLAWSAPRLVRQAPLPFPPCQTTNPGPGAEMYPSLIDHDDVTDSFERTGRTAWLYFVRWNQGLDRDLWRAPVTFLRQ